MDEKLSVTEQLKSGVALEIRGVLSRRGLLQSDAAAILGVPASKVSDVVRGRLRGYSLDRLTDWLQKLMGE